MLLKTCTTCTSNESTANPVQLSFNCTEAGIRTISPCGHQPAAATGCRDMLSYSINNHAPTSRDRGAICSSSSGHVHTAHCKPWATQHDHLRLHIYNPDSVPEAHPASSIVTLPDLHSAPRQGLSAQKHTSPLMTAAPRHTPCALCLQQSLLLTTSWP